MHRNCRWPGYWIVATQGLWIHAGTTSLVRNSVVGFLFTPFMPNTMQGGWEMPYLENRWISTKYHFMDGRHAFSTAPKIEAPCWPTSYLGTCPRIMSPCSSLLTHGMTANRTSMHCVLQAKWCVYNWNVIPILLIKTVVPCAGRELRWLCQSSCTP